ncbi:MAG TPA: hypothetical protein VN457_02360, partial [Chlamydiales bacterium]|nr:hypothetical protein [Chlamydiales bacterium]
MVTATASGPNAEATPSGIVKMTRKEAAEQRRRASAENLAANRDVTISGPKTNHCCSCCCLCWLRCFGCAPQTPSMPTIALSDVGKLSWNTRNRIIHSTVEVGATSAAGYSAVIPSSATVAPPSGIAPLA